MGRRRSYSDAEVEAAVQALTQPGRMREAERLVSSAAPQLQRILTQALEDGGWFGSAHQEAVRHAVADADPAERQRAVATLLAEEARITMLVGVAAGLELAHQLDQPEEE